MITRHLTTLSSLSADDLKLVLDLSEQPSIDQVLAGQGVALCFDKPSLRTRHATEMAVTQLGGHPITSSAGEAPIDIRESAEDTARTLSQYHALIGARVFDHSVIERMAMAASVPVVNLLSDTHHPLQALADLLTIRQHLGDLSNLRIAWIGDFTNVARSLAQGLALAGASLVCASPKDFAPGREDFDFAVANDHEFVWTLAPEEATAGADVVMTDCWYSMGQESQALERAEILAKYRVDQALMKTAKGSAKFLHCLPAHRGQEVTSEVIDGPQSLVWAAAQNRMHTARGAIAFLLGAKSTR